MSDALINVGLDNLVAKDQVVAIARPDSVPIKRIIDAHKQGNKVIDLTRGRRTRAVIFTRSEFLILAPLRSQTLGERYTAE